MECGSVWSGNKDHRNKLEAFEMWLWRRMLKISWTEKVSNQQVLARIQEERSLLNSIQQRKHMWLGHVYIYIYYVRHDVCCTNYWRAEWKGREEEDAGNSG